jgi:DNA/RNA-binding domain of Phe-tRNA-synthetase-like protein
MLSIADYPLLDVAAIVTQFPVPLGQLKTPEPVVRLLTDDGDVPLSSDDDVRRAVRELLRQRGYKPTGRGKPSSEYLIKAVADGRLAAINPAVDTCNVVSRHSGLPISVVDLDRLTEPLSIAVAAAGTQYVFNVSGQVIAAGGLPCLFDAAGPCANAVKDAQRSKTTDSTTRTLSIIWGTTALTGRTATAADWYCRLLREAGGRPQFVDVA